MRPVTEKKENKWKDQKNGRKKKKKKRRFDFCGKGKDVGNALRLHRNVETLKKEKALGQRSFTRIGRENL